ncbi:MAG: nickel pincer cofactor biosynthesis protein LarC [Oscillospiraceae bacterium]|nr:nickel pincer cofactor biosynthesis protein LarC [Oscillospiraceae bacterium]
MKILYFDCFSGISGDMTLAALLDLCPENFDFLVSDLKTLGLEGWEIIVGRREKNGINANHVKVALPPNDRGDHAHHHHPNRNYANIAHMIDHSEMSAGAKLLSKNIFKRIATAEAKVHGVGFREVHFHEVGAADSIIDIAGASVLLDLLVTQHGIERICSSPISDGYGFAYCQHGKIPVPAPATVEIFKEAGAKTRQIEVESELATPTGAAIIAEIAQSYGLMPEMKALKSGYGAGTKDLAVPNVLRVILGDSEGGGAGGATENITVIETNIDDCSPEILAYTMEKLFCAGASDVFFTPVYMKKNRPATQLTALCQSGLAEKLANVIFSETTTIGLRMREEKRICLARGIAMVQTDFGGLRVKKVEFEGEEKWIPEYEDAKRLARESGVPLHKIYESVKK